MHLPVPFAQRRYSMSFLVRRFILETIWCADEKVETLLIIVLLSTHNNRCRKGLRHKESDNVQSLADQPGSDGRGCETVVHSLSMTSLSGLTRLTLGWGIATAIYSVDYRGMRKHGVDSEYV